MKFTKRASLQLLLLQKVYNYWLAGGLEPGDGSTGYNIVLPHPSFFW